MCSWWLRIRLTQGYGKTLRWCGAKLFSPVHIHFYVFRVSTGRFEFQLNFFPPLYFHNFKYEKTNNYSQPGNFYRRPGCVSVGMFWRALPEAIPPGADYGGSGLYRGGPRRDWPPSHLYVCPRQEFLVPLQVPMSEAEGDCGPAPPARPDHGERHHVWLVRNLPTAEKRHAGENM